MSIRKLFVISSLSLLVIFNYSCKKDDDKGASLSSDDAKEVLASVDQVFAENLVKVQDSEAVNSLNNLMVIMETNNPIGEIDFLKSANIRKDNQIISSLLPKFGKKSKTSDDCLDDFNEIAGTYSWNFTAEDWDISATPTNAVVIQFPATPESATNNAVFTISTFEQQSFEDDWGGWVEVYCQPTNVAAELVVDGAKVGELSLSATYDSDGEPTKMSVRLWLEPLELTIDLNQSSNTSASVKAGFKVDETSIVSVDIKATLMYDEDWDEYYASKLNGYFQFGPIKVDGSIDIEGFEQAAYTAETSADVNSYIKLTLYEYPANNKIGTLKFVDISSEGFTYPILAIVFNDGTYEPAEEYMATMLASIEEALADLGYDLDDMDMKKKSKKLKK